MTFQSNFNLCFKDYIFISYHFLVELTYKVEGFMIKRYAIGRGKHIKIKVRLR